MHRNFLFLFFILMLSASSSLAQVQHKLSPLVRQALMQQKVSSSSRKSPAAKGANESVITAFVRTSDVDALRHSGCRIYAQWDDICIASIPLSRLGEIANMPQVKRIEARERSCVTNDTTASITNARKAWSYKSSVNNISGYTGKGVVVGIEDIGFDLTHPTFWSSDRQIYRVKAFWDHLERGLTGSPVIDGDTVYVGRQYLSQGELLAKGHSYDGFSQTHGTHTTGTATGSGRGASPMELPTAYTLSGMAPEADICLVANATGDNSDSIPKSELYKYNATLDILGFKYIFDYAKSLGKPCVINFSEGSYDDLYQSGIYSEVVKKIVGPGQIICASAGNNGENATYLHKKQGVEKASAYLAKWKSNTGLYVARSKAPIQLALSVYSNGQTKVLEWNYDCTELANYPDSVFTDTLRTENYEFIVSLNTYPSCFNEEEFATDIYVQDTKNKNLGYSPYIGLQVFGRENDIEVITQGGYFLNLGSVFCDAEYSHNVCFPGSVEGVICVGATSYISKTQGYSHENIGYNFGTDGIRADYSSIGPSIYGGIKPDVMAPGTNISSSLNSYWAEANPDDAAEYLSNYSSHNGKKYPWGVMTGTSMACPVATGIVALWLQACPTLSPAQVLDVIAHTSTHYDGSLTYPNIEYGWGQIDALEGLKYIEQTFTGIEELSIIHPSHQRIYDLSGRQLPSLSGRTGIFIISDGCSTRKVVIRQ